MLMAKYTHSVHLPKTREEDGFHFGKVKKLSPPLTRERESRIWPPSRRKRETICQPSPELLLSSPSPSTSPSLLPTLTREIGRRKVITKIEIRIPNKIHPPPLSIHVYTRFRAESDEVFVTKKMLKMFSAGIGVEDDEIQKQPQTSSSLLSDWNSYASSRVSEESSTTLVAGFDLKAVVRSTNDSVTGTFDV